MLREEMNTLATILPAGIEVSEGDQSGTITLAAEEAALLERLIDCRRREFAFGRECARRAMAKLGIPAVPILVGGGREPVWPSNIVGSITHCDGYCAAAVGLASRFVAVGIDAEVNDSLPGGVLELVASYDECRGIAALPQTGVAWDRVLFSAKEVVYKVWYPCMRTWLGFEDVSLSIFPDRTYSGRGAFTARMTRAPLVACNMEIVSLRGSFLVDRSRVLTAAAVEH